MCFPVCYLDCSYDSDRLLPALLTLPALRILSLSDACPDLSIATVDESALPTLHLLLSLNFACRQSLYWIHPYNGEHAICSSDFFAKKDHMSAVRGAWQRTQGHSTLHSFDTLGTIYQTSQAKALLYLARR